jgi:hypothetical protein
MTTADRPIERHRGPVRRLLFAFISLDSFGSVLMLILLTYILSVSATESWESAVVLVVQIATVWLALRVSRARRGAVLLASVVLVLAAIVAIWAVVDGTSTGSTGAVFLASSLLYLIAPLSILRAIVTSGTVDQETVLGAVDAYLLMGMFFAYVYQGLTVLQSGAFFEGGVDGGVADSLFFSFTTLTTTGYGNLVPASNPGQSVAVLEMLIGQLFLVTAVAKVINAWRPARWKVPEQGDPDS